MVRRYAKVSKRVSRGKRTYKRYSRYRRTGYKSLSRRISAVSKRVAGEVNKWQITPDMFTNYTIGYTEGTGYNFTLNLPLQVINSGQPWVMPLNWIYTAAPDQAVSQKVYINGLQYNTNDILPTNQRLGISSRNPLWYNTLDPAISNNDFQGTELQYRLAYIYIRGIFRANTTNDDGAMRFVIVKDKQPQGGSATWFDQQGQNNQRGVFTSNLIDAQLNPATTGRFKIMYDKTLRFSKIQSYKPFSYFKRISSVVRNTRKPQNSDSIDLSNSLYQSKDSNPPVLRNAYYLMIFSDGLKFTYGADSSTLSEGFHMFSRIGYYNN